MKHIVGIMPLWDDEKDSIWMLPGYLEGIKHAGGIPIIFPLSTEEQELEQLIEMCDGFLFTGGHDVSPRIYNEDPMECVDSCEVRDKMEMIVLKKAMDADKPILGICRGIQFINAALGGTLYQDIPKQCPSSIEHHQSPPYDIPVHDVSIVNNSPLQKCLRVSRLSVNSYHHQAVKAVAPELSVMAVSSDGIVEALYRENSRFLWAVQWHPEFSYKTDANSRKILEAFINAI
ncbi:MAG: gamma-glutamyl-gamma-aminobutyrate hydrolase family protein [Lachnospiraceae bacterium]|nr:gamma-glutamyl-gamma-aminobutyrate hydrolase family protein [Lachnospiraceae bacterium]